MLLYDTLHTPHCAAAGNNVRLQQELDQSRAATAPINFQKLDADRLQAAYYSYDSVSRADQAAGSASSSHSQAADYPGSSHSPGSRPSSARRTSRQQTAGSNGPSLGAGAGSIGVRPGSSAARRTKELLQQAGISSVLQGGPPSHNMQQSRPMSSGVQRAMAGGLQRGQPGASGGMLLGGASDQPVVPKARGLVRGSTDAWQLNARPASRGL